MTSGQPSPSSQPWLMIWTFIRRHCSKDAAILSVVTLWDQSEFRCHKENVLTSVSSHRQSRPFILLFAAYELAFQIYAHSLYLE